MTKGMREYRAYLRSWWYGRRSRTAGKEEKKALEARATRQDAFGYGVAGLYPWANLTGRHNKMGSGK